MTTKKQTCGNELKFGRVALYIVYYYIIRRLLVYADFRPDGAARVVATCELDEGHKGRCKSSKVKLEVASITWWK